jgi:H+-translocating NAD(P) transhydrogenase subunit beta
VRLPLLPRSLPFGKLSGKVSGKPVTFSGQHMLNLILAILMVAAGVVYFLTDSHAAFLAMCAVALVLGVTLIIPIGGADMPVVVSMLNSYSGWAAAGIGFTLNNPVLIIAGACVGSSGAILSYIMCKAMNRSIIAVLLGGFGAEAAAGGDDDGAPKNYKSGSAEDAAFLMTNADTVIIVPGYGLAGCPRAACTQRVNREINAPWRNGEVCNPPGCWTDAWPHERLAGGSRSTLRPSI